MSVTNLHAQTVITKNIQKEAAMHLGLNDFKQTSTSFLYFVYDFIIIIIIIVAKTIFCEFLRCT